MSPVTTTDYRRPLAHSGTSSHAVVLLHGFTGHPGHWLPFGEELAARGHTYVAPLLPGHGSEPAELAGKTLDDWLTAAGEAVASVADHRAIHLVGLSLGGLLAILLAGPTAAATITTINSPVLVREPKLYLAPIARHFVGWAAADQDPVPDPDLSHLWYSWDRQPVDAAAELVRAIRRAFVAAGRLRRPALVVQSRTDEAVFPFSGTLLASRMHARVMWLDACRHNAILDPSRPLLHRAILDHLEVDRSS